MLHEHMYTENVITTVFDLSSDQIFKIGIMDSLSELDSRNISGQLEKKLQTTQEGLETKPTSTSNPRIYKYII